MYHEKEAAAKASREANDMKEEAERQVKEKEACLNKEETEAVEAEAQLAAVKKALGEAEKAGNDDETAAAKKALEEAEAAAKKERDEATAAKTEADAAKILAEEAEAKAKAAQEKKAKADAAFKELDEKRKRTITCNVTGNIEAFDEVKFVEGFKKSCKAEQVSATFKYQEIVKGDFSLEQIIDGTSMDVKKFRKLLAKSKGEFKVSIELSDDENKNWLEERLHYRCWMANDTESYRFCVEDLPAPDNKSFFSSLFSSSDQPQNPQELQMAVSKGPAFDKFDTDKFTADLEKALGLKCGIAVKAHKPLLSKTKFKITVTVDSGEYQTARDKLVPDAIPQIGDYEYKMEEVAEAPTNKEVYLNLQIEEPLETFDTEKFVEAAKAEIFKDVELKEVKAMASALSPKKRTTVQALVPEDFDVSTIAPGTMIGGYKIAGTV